MFCSEMLRMFAAASDGGPGARALLQVVTAALEAMSDPAPEWALPIFEHTQKVLRGLVAMLSPVPGLLGSLPSDVKYIFPDEGRSSMIVRDVPKIGKIWVAKMRESAFWSATREACLKKAGKEATSGQPCLACHLLAQRLGLEKETSYDDRSELYEAFAAGAAEWKKCFRKGVTSEVQAVLERFLKIDVADVTKDMTTRSVDEASLLLSVIGLCDGNVGALKQDLVRALTHWQDSAQRNDVATCSAEFMTTPSISNLVLLKSAVQSCRSKVLPSKEAVLLEQVAQASFRLIVQTPDVATWGDLIELWDIFKGSIEIFGSGNGVDTASLLTLVTAFSTSAKMVWTWCRKMTEFDITSEDMEAQLVSLLEAYSPVSRAEWKSDNVTDAAYVAFPTFLNSGLISTLHTDFMGIVAESTKYREALLQKTVHFLEQVSGGSTGGSHWHDTFTGEHGIGPTNLQKHFENTLAKYDTNQISRYTRQVEQATRL